jgi:hypothetical protein
VLDVAHCPSLPSRSQLFSLPLAGEDPYGQEALLDFAQRLSLEHRVAVRDMFAQVILPEANLNGAFFLPGHFSARALGGCSGWSSYARAFLSAMQRLTGREDMNYGSLATWAGLLDPKGYVAKKRRWCPECLHEQTEHGLPTFRLMWAFDPVRVCPIHLLVLSESCARCGKGQPVIGDALAHGLCQHCRSSLSSVRSRVRPSLHGSDLFKARSVAGMIGARGRATVLATDAVYKQRIHDAAEHAANGSVFRLEKQLKLSYRSLSGPGRHTLAFFLEIMYRLGIEPVPFLAGSSAAGVDPALSIVPFRSQRRTTPTEFSEISKRVDARLEKALADQTRLTTRLEFIRDVGITNTCLQARFAKVKTALREHNDRIRPAVHRALWDHRSALISRAMQDLVAGGGPFTASAISRALRDIGLHRRDPRVRKLSSDALDRARTNGAQQYTRHN